VLPSNTSVTVPCSLQEVICPVFDVFPRVGRNEESASYSFRLGRVQEGIALDGGPPRLGVVTRLQRRLDPKINVNQVVALPAELLRVAMVISY